MDWLLALHIIVLAMGTGMSLANWLSFRVAASEEKAGKAALARQRLMVGQVGDVVIALIWLSGLALTWRFTGADVAGTAALPTAFHAKMLLVVLLTVCHGVSRWAGLRIMRQGRAELIPLARSCTLGTHLSAVGSIVLAVASFG